MPIRNNENASAGTGNRLPKGKREKIESLTTSAGSYLNLKSQIDTLTKDQDKHKATIKEAINDPEIYEMNGKHKEVTLDAGDGKTKYFVQLQVAESVKTVDNIVSLMRKKLGKKADNFITSVEVLTPNALDSAYNQGLITEKDVLDWTTTTTTERLIVKPAK